MTKRMPQRNGKKNSKETKNAFATRQHFFLRPQCEDAEDFEWKLKIHIQFCFCGVGPLETLICADTQRMDGWEKRCANTTKKSRTMMTWSTRMPAGIGFKQFPFIFFRFSSPSFLSLACALASLLILTPCWALAPFYQHIFDGKNNNTVSNEKRGPFQFTVTQPLLLSSMPRIVFSFLFSFQKYHKVSGHCRRR